MSRFFNSISCIKSVTKKWHRIFVEGMSRFFHKLYFSATFFVQKSKDCHFSSHFLYKKRCWKTWPKKCSTFYILALLYNHFFSSMKSMLEKFMMKEMYSRDCLQIGFIAQFGFWRWLFKCWLSNSAIVSFQLRLSIGNNGLLAWDSVLDRCFGIR